VLHLLLLQVQMLLLQLQLLLHWNAKYGAAAGTASGSLLILGDYSN
jgi:hypothetical protein